MTSKYRKREGTDAFVHLFV